MREFAGFMGAVGKFVGLWVFLIVLGFGGYAGCALLLGGTSNAPPYGSSIDPSP